MGRDRQDMNIRPMKRTDVVFFNTVRNMVRHCLHDDSEYTVDQSYAWFDSNHPEFYIIEVDKDPIGYFRTSNRESDSMWIGADIHPYYQGKGYAYEAYQMFINMMKKKYGIKYFWLSVLKTNPRAIRLYKKIGFTANYTSDRDVLMSYGVVEDSYEMIAESIMENSLFREKFDNTCVWVLGAAGFVGTWICNVLDYLNEHYNCGISIYACDINTEPMYWIRTRSNYTHFRTINIVYDPLDDISPEFPDYIFNCTGVANPMLYMQQPKETLDVSYIGTKRILEYAKQINIEGGVLCFSSSEVYGTPESNAIPTPETHIGRIHTTSNRSCYDIGKLVLETLCHYYSKDIPIVVVRPFNLYGPLMRDARVVSKFMNSAITNNQIEVYGDGKQTRTYCYISDAITMLLKLMSSEKSEDIIYNIGISGPEITANELAGNISNIVDSQQINLENVEYPSSYPDDEPRRRCPDIKKITENIGYCAKVPLILGLLKTYEYYKQLNNAVQKNSTL